MAAQATYFRARYYAGETARIAVEADGAESVTLVVGASTVALERGADGAWRGCVATDGLLGTVRWTAFAAFADGSREAVAHGSFAVVCAGRSPLRDVVDAIDEAIRTWGTNPNQSISVGEVNISYKTLDDLLAVRSQYEQRAVAQETGSASASGGVRVMEVRF